jgi:hypothetical protein
MIRKPQHLAIANTSFICILGLLNGGAMAINLQLEYSLPILPLLFFLSALFSMIFWMYCANKLTLEPEKQKKSSTSSSHALVDLERPSIHYLNDFRNNSK